MEKIHNLIASVTGGEKIGFLDTSQQSLYISAASIVFNPVFWNIVARQEYKTHFLTRFFRSPYYGCYFLALVIFSIGIVRDYLYSLALDSQPLYPPLHQPLIGALFFVFGNILVLTSMYALGFTGTYLGDYFGILMEKKVEGFPFNVVSAPMYVGSTLNFLGTALWKGKVAGIGLTALVWVMYTLALRFEDPFTADIYAKKDARPVTRSMTKAGTATVTTPDAKGSGSGVTRQRRKA